jgi:hypothetical protein
MVMVDSLIEKPVSLQVGIAIARYFGVFFCKHLKIVHELILHRKMVLEDKLLHF